MLQTTVLFLVARSLERDDQTNALMTTFDENDTPVNNLTKFLFTILV